jgi:hypothetical protein
MSLHVLELEVVEVAKGQKFLREIFTTSKLYCVVLVSVHIMFLSILMLADGYYETNRTFMS